MRITDVILLAAGRSERMGQPKQLLDIKGVTMIQHTINVIQKCSRIRHLVVVLGFQANRIQNLVSKNRILIVENMNWNEGMGSSLRAGLRKALEIIPAADDLLITVCDQPLLNTEVLENLIDQHRPAHITAASYGDAFGTPALFDRRFLPDLLSLPDQSGARKLFEKYPQLLRKVPFPGGEFDLDTWDDYEKFISRSNS